MEKQLRTLTPLGTLMRLRSLSMNLHLDVEVIPKEVTESVERKVRGFSRA